MEKILEDNISDISYEYGTSCYGDYLSINNIYIEEDDCLIPISVLNEIIESFGESEDYTSDTCETCGSFNDTNTGALTDKIGKSVVFNLIKNEKKEEVFRAETPQIKDENNSK